MNIIDFPDEIIIIFLKLTDNNGFYNLRIVCKRIRKISFHKYFKNLLVCGNCFIFQDTINKGHGRCTHYLYNKNHKEFDLLKHIEEFPKTNAKIIKYFIKYVDKSNKSMIQAMEWAAINNHIGLIIFLFKNGFTRKGLFKYTVICSDDGVGNLFIYLSNPEATKFLFVDNIPYHDYVIQKIVNPRNRTFLW